MGADLDRVGGSGRFEPCRRAWLLNLGCGSEGGSGSPARGLSIQAEGGKALVNGLREDPWKSETRETK